MRPGVQDNLGNRFEETVVLWERVGSRFEGISAKGRHADSLEGTIQYAVQPRAHAQKNCSAYYYARYIPRPSRNSRQESILPNPALHK